tara:strand:+ start:546 stop:3260 length:2715 start_codon:yes stop_codon:yes gene_type:complete
MPYIGQGLQQGRRQRSTFTATASQTTFAHSYAVGYVDVYQNGILLAPSDYTATNGTQIVLAVGAALNDEITIISQHLFSVADVVSATGGTFSGNVTVTGNLTVQGSTIAVDTATAQTVDLGDSDKVRLGDGNDLQMYHDGSNSYIDHIGPDEQTLYIRNTTSTTNTTDGIVLESNNHYVHITNNAAVRFGVNGSDMISVIGSGTYFNHDVILNGTGKEIKYRNGSYYVTLDAVNATTDTTAIVPNFDGTIPVFTTAPTSAIADGTAGQVLTTDGAGALSFTTVANSSFTTDVTVTSSGISGSANLMLNNTETTNNFGKAIEAFRSGITTGKRHQILLGKDSSNNDTSTISYYYAGNASSNNRLEFGFWGADALLNVRADGNIGIGTDSPSQKLHISSADHTRVLITGGTDKYAELQFENDAQKFAMGVQNDDKFFLYNSTGTSQVLTIDTSNNIGIGTQSPGALLTVSKTASDHTSAAISIENTQNGGYGGILNFVSTRLGSQVTAATIGTDGQENWSSVADTSSNLKFSTVHDGTLAQRMKIRSNGNVGIGTNSPDTLLNLQKTRAGSISAGSSDTGAVIKLHTEAQWESGYGNTIDSTSNDYLGSIEFSSGDGSTGEGVRAAIRGTVDSYYNTNSIVFETANSATAEAPIERMRILYNGKVGIGTGVPSVGLEVSGDTPNDEIAIKYSGTAGGHNSKYLFKDKRGQTNAGIYNNLQDDGVGSAAAHMQFYTSTGGTLSTQMAISRYGYVTTPNQPSCSVYNLGFSGTATSWSSAGSGSVNGAIYSSDVHHNNGNHYNTSNGYFTAPTDGYFLCNLNVYGKKNTNHGDGAGYWWGYFQKNGGYYAGNYIMEAYYNSGDYDQGASISAVIKLALNDTVRPYMGAYADGMSVYGPNTSFSVHMIG